MLPSSQTGRHRRNLRDFLIWGPCSIDETQGEVNSSECGNKGWTMTIDSEILPSYHITTEFVLLSLQITP